MSDLDIVILAAGKGSRMKSALPKVMHQIGGKPMINHVIDTARKLSPREIFIIYGDGGEYVKNRLQAPDLTFIEQEEQLGTGHAVMMASSFLNSKKTLILYGDVPLINEKTLLQLIDSKSKLTILTANLNDPRGYGRVLRGKSTTIKKIVEEKDATPAERLVKEINTGILVANSRSLQTWLPKLKKSNAQKEYYLTDLIGLAIQDDCKIESASPDTTTEILGINTKRQLAKLERVFQKKLASCLTDQGVTLADLERLDIRGNITCGEDVFIDVNCIFEGEIILKQGVKIGANCIIRNSSIGEGTEILPFSFIDNVEIGKYCKVGPYARLRPETILNDNVSVGNFVEVKKTNIGEGSKVNHLTYLGDADLGKKVNVGAGTITCNYDGIKKHKTKIEDQSFIGSNSSLVAPLQVKKGSVIGAGSTITKDTKAGKLTLSRSNQKTIENWVHPSKDKK